MTGEEFRQLRKRARRSVAETARQLECSERTIKRWQSWPHVPPAAVKLFRLLNADRLAEDLTAAAGGGDVAAPK